MRSNYELATMLVKRLYKKNAQTILNINDLDYLINNENNFIIYEKSLENNKLDTSLVVGGACIDRCEGDIRKLGYNFYYDILMPINYALKHSMNCAIFVDTPIEVFSNSQEEIKIWQDLVSKIEAFLDNLSQILNIEIKVIRRDYGYKILDEILKNEKFTDEELKGLYDLVPSLKHTIFGDDLLLHFRRSIISYLPQFLSEYLNRTIQNVIVVEELSQSKAISKAHNINSNIAAKLYVDMPSTSCHNRMHRSTNGKVRIFEKINREKVDPLFLDFIDNLDLTEIYKRLHITNYELLVKELERVWFY